MMTAIANKALKKAIVVAEADGNRAYIHPDDIQSIFVTYGFPKPANAQRPLRNIWDSHTSYHAWAGVTVNTPFGKSYGLIESLPRFLAKIAEAGRDLETVPVETMEYFLSKKDKPVKGLGVRSANQFVRAFKI